MSKTRKINLLCLIFAAICCLFSGFLFGSTTKASAAEPIEPKTFEMVSGASIRITDGQVNGKDMTNGLRFQVKTDAETAALIAGENVKLYAFIAPVGVVDLTSDEKVAAAADNIVGYKSKWLEIAADSIYPMKEESGEVCHYANAVICNLSSDFYDVKFNAIAIIENGGAYTYAKAVSTSRSLYDVVNNAVLDKYADRIVGNSVAENTKLDYAKWYGTAEYPVAPQTPAQFNKYNELKSTTLKNLSIERQDVMVNNPVVTIGGKEYSIPTVPEVHGEQDVEVTVEGATVTVPVTIIDAVLTAENFKEIVQCNDATKVLNEGKYFILNADIDACDIDWKANANWGDKKDDNEKPIETGFKGSIDGRGHTVKNLNIESGVPGIFNYTNNATVKNINFTVSNFVPQDNKSVFGVITEKTLFENVTVTFDCVFTATKGGILSGNNAVSNTYKDIQIIAEDGKINTLSQSSFNSKFENVTVESMKMNYVYGTSPSVEGVTFKKINVVTLTNNQDILLTNETYAISLGSEGAGLTINSITCDGISLGTDLTDLDLSAFKSDYTKHGNKTITVKGEKDGNKVTIIATVTLVTKMISTQTELRSVVTTITDTTVKAIFGYYKLANDIDYSDGFHNGDPGFSWGNSKQGFRATLDGNGKTITGFAHNQGLFNSIGEGAVIKNINFVSTRWSGANDRLFGIASYGATFENVNIVMRSEDGSKVPSVHLLFAEACQNNTFKNITLKVYSDNGSTLAGLSTVFGKNFTGNICEGVKIYCKSLVELGKDSEGHSITKYEEVTVYNTEK